MYNGLQEDQRFIRIVSRRNVRIKGGDRVRLRADEVVESVSGCGVDEAVANPFRGPHSVRG